MEGQSAERLDLGTWVAWPILMGNAWSLQLSCGRPLQHSPGRAIASSGKFKAHFREAARSLASCTSVAEEGHLQGLLGSHRCRQLAVDWSVESQVVDLKSSPCRAGPWLISSGSVLWLNHSWTCASPGSRLHLCHNWNRTSQDNQGMTSTCCKAKQQLVHRNVKSLCLTTQICADSTNVNFSQYLISSTQMSFHDRAASLATSSMLLKKMAKAFWKVFGG